ncbi:MAG: hypothetical protein C4K58_03670 [Flavobacteriaceae bacterium]|nr:MAG: hypothetical protein C4K58_03670 [Flavobacteriaceae bacterium]
MQWTLTESKSKLTFTIATFKKPRYVIITWKGLELHREFITKCYGVVYFIHKILGYNLFLEDSRCLYNVRTKEDWIKEDLIPKISKLKLKKWAIVLGDDPITNNSYLTVKKHVELNTNLKVKIFENKAQAVDWLMEKD